MIKVGPIILAGEVNAMINATGEADRGPLSLEQIEDDAWGDPPPGATRLVRTAHELRRKPIATLTPNDLRLLIGQQIGVDVLLPRALALLAGDPLVDGDFYPGDLLVAVMRLPSKYWAGHPGQATALRKIAQAARHEDSSLHGAIEGFSR
jgi:hypothetical protein